MQSKLPVLGVVSPTGASVPPRAAQAGGAPFAGVLSIHFEEGRCRVRCPFCYLGQRRPAKDASDDQASDGTETLEGFAGRAAAALQVLPYREVAITLSEPIEPVLPALLRIAAARREGVPLAITTTIAAATELVERAAALGAAQELWGQIDRLSLSVDPFKAPTDAAVLGAFAGRIKAACAAQRSGAPFIDLALIVTVSQPGFAEALFAGGLLAALVDLPAVDRVAVNAVKPPPPFCDRAFWLRALQHIGPLLRRELDRRLFLDCYVAARLLQLGGCPGRPDLSPQDGGLAYRACVYQPVADLVAAPDDPALREALVSYIAPAACPFPIR